MDAEEQLITAVDVGEDVDPLAHLMRRWQSDPNARLASTLAVTKAPSEK